jgi:hypothetical protein
MRRETNHDEASAPRKDGEGYWRALFYLLSAAMVAYGLVQLGAGRVAGALGDVGVACLMVSLIPQFPFVRAILARSERNRSEEQLLCDLERARTRSPWAESVSAAGWLFLGISFLLRALGVA